MKPSHRKDVILARLVFAVFCLAVIAGAGTLTVKIIRSHNAKVAEAEAEAPAETEMVVTGLEDLTEVTEEVEATEIVTVYVETTTSVNLRSLPSTDGEIITLLDAGVQLELVSEENGWTQVIYNGETGYVSSDFVEEVEVTEGVQSADSGTTTMTTNDSVRMRSGASTDYDIVTNVPTGTEVTVTGEENGWKQVEYNGKTGYIRADFLE